MSRLVEGVAPTRRGGSHKMGWLYTHVWWLRIWSDISVTGVSPERWWISASTPGSLGQSTGARKRGPRNNKLWKPVGIACIQVRWKAAGNPGIMLKGQHTNSLAGTQLNSSRETGDRNGIEEETKLCGCRANAREMAAVVPFAWSIGAIFPLLIPAPITLKCESALEW